MEIKSYEPGTKFQPGKWSAIHMANAIIHTPENPEDLQERVHLSILKEEPLIPVVALYFGNGGVTYTYDTEFKTILIHSDNILQIEPGDEVFELANSGVFGF